MWKSSPSPMRATPTRIRKASARILIVGCSSMKAEIGPESHIITTMEAMMAAAMIGTWSGRARPTAVNTESSEKTMSITAICSTMAVKLATMRAARSAAAPSSVWWISSTLLTSRKRPPPPRIRSRPEICCPNSSNQGCVRRVSQMIENSRARRVNMASARPTTRARGWRAGGSRPTRIARKRMLSMPSTISSSVRVANAAQVPGWFSSCSMRAPATPRCSRSGQVVDRLFHRGGQQMLGLQATVQRNGARDVDRGIGAGDDADDQARRKAVERMAVEHVERHHDDERHDLGHDGSRQRLVDRLVEHGHRLEPAAPLEALTDTIEDHHGVIQRIADHREHGRHHRQVEGGMPQRESAEHQDRVVQHREDRTERETPGMETNGDVQADQKQRGRQRQHRSALEFLPYLRVHPPETFNLGARIDRVQHALNPCADHVTGLAGLRWQADRGLARGAQVLDLFLAETGALQPQAQGLDIDGIAEADLHLHAAGEFHCQIETADKERAD